jgi:hypothetical protein
MAKTADDAQLLAEANQAIDAGNDDFPPGFQVQVVDVYEQSSIPQVTKVPVVKILSPGLERMGHLTEFIALSWLSKALDKNVTRVYILRRHAGKVEIIRFKHTVNRGDDKGNFVWSQTPFHDGAKVIVCCEGERLKPELVKQLPELKSDKGSGFKSKVSRLRKFGERLKRSVSFVSLADTDGASPSSGSSPPASPSKARLRKEPEADGCSSESPESIAATSSTTDTSEGGWLGSEASACSSPRQLPPLEAEHLQPLAKDKPVAGTLAAQVKAALEAEDSDGALQRILSDSKLPQIQNHHVELLKHLELDAEDLNDPLLLQVALLEARVASAETHLGAHGTKGDKKLKQKQLDRNRSKQKLSVTFGAESETQKQEFCVTCGGRINDQVCMICSKQAKEIGEVEHVEKIVAPVEKQVKISKSWWPTCAPCKSECKSEDAEDVPDILREH